MESTTQVKINQPTELRVGDILPGSGGYTVTSDPVTTPAGGNSSSFVVRANVRYHDGGLSVREWINPAETFPGITVERPA